MPIYHDPKYRKQYPMTNTNPTQVTSPTSPTQKTGEIEIDFLELARKLWENRRFILKVTSIFAAIGLFVAIFSAKEYTSSITMVPQLSDAKSKVGGLAGLAAMAGVNLGDMGGGDVLSPTIYPKLMDNVLLKRDLMYSKFKFKEVEHPISLYDYYTNPNYQPFNLFATVTKYTLGLPGVIIRVFTGDKDGAKMKMENNGLIQLTVKENRVAKLLSKNIVLLIDEKEGTLGLSVTMPEAEVSTAVVVRTQELLQKYITDFKVDKVRRNMLFIGERYAESKTTYESKQRELGIFRDVNRNMISALARTQEEKLVGEYNLLYSVYVELAKQYEQARITVKDESPVLTIIQPAFIPNRAQKPNKMLMLLGFCFLGFVSSSSIITFRYFGGKFKPK